MFINTNIASINAQRNLYQTTFSLDRTIDRLSTGLRINTAADDASGLNVADKIYCQKRGLSTAIQNTNDSTAFYRTAEGALSQVGKMLSRLEELAVRAATDTVRDTDRAAIVKEAGELIGQIQTVSENTEYNTIKVLKEGLASTSLLKQQGSGLADSVKVLVNPLTVRDGTSVTLSVISLAQHAQLNGAQLFGTTIFALSTNYVNNIFVNGVPVTVVAADNLGSILAKINAVNSASGVVAVNSGAGSFALVSGRIDPDAQNVPALGTGSPSPDAIGYLNVGASAQVNIAGDPAILAKLALAPGMTSSGTNAQANVDGVAMVVDLSQGANVLKMDSAGSNANGLTIATDMYNGAYGGIILNNQPPGNQISHTSDNTGLDEFKISFTIGDTFTMHVGANYDQKLDYKMDSCDTELIGTGASSKFGSLSEISLENTSDANISIKVIQKAIEDVSAMRSKMGNIINRLSHASITLQVQHENMAAAESKIRDADISLEMTNFTKQQILMQAGTSILAQANSKTQGVLQLLK